MQELETTSEESTLWDNPQKAQKILQEKSLISEKINLFHNLSEDFNSQTQYLKLAEEEQDLELILETTNNIEKIWQETEILATKTMFNQPFDHLPCFLEINAGAGGSDSCDFAAMLLRMYQRFCQIQGFTSEIIDILDGEEAGIKSAHLRISGDFAFGWLRSEIGVHRLVRISPFNANDKRQTSFASVWVYPEADEELDIIIADKDLRIDTFRASGAGGQHVNKTDSAVRITHLPTNVVVQCQSDRSQIRNRTQAMKMLKAKLTALEIQKKQQQQQKLEASKTDNSWGHQIRSYVLHPYQMVKDLRSGSETSNINAFLDGEIADFIKSNLQYQLNQKNNDS